MIFEREFKEEECKPKCRECGFKHKYDLLNTYCEKQAGELLERFDLIRYCEKFKKEVKFLTESLNEYKTKYEALYMLLEKKDSESVGLSEKKREE